MADEQVNEQDAPESGGKKKPPIMLIGIVAGLMVLEGVLVFALVSMTGGGPAESVAQGIEGEDLAGDEATIEIPLITGPEAKFQNMTTGRPWMWEIEVYLKVKNKNKELVEKIQEQRQAEIREGLSVLFSRAQHRHLKEPGQETIRRQVAAFAHDIFGTDPDGVNRVEKVLLPSCRGYDASG